KAAHGSKEEIAAADPVSEVLEAEEMPESAISARELAEFAEVMEDAGPLSGLGLGEHILAADEIMEEVSSATFKAESIFDENLMPSEPSGHVPIPQQAESEIRADPVTGSSALHDESSAKKPLSPSAKKTAKAAAPDSSTVS